MLETTNFSIHFGRFLYSTVSGYFILSGCLAGLYFLRFRERLASRHFVLCTLLLLYTLATLAYTFGTPIPSINRLLISSIYLLGPTIFVIYANQVSQLLHTNPRWLPYALLPLRLLPMAITADLLWFFFVGKSLFFSETPNHEVRNWYVKAVSENITIEPTIFLVLIPAMAALVMTSALFLIKYRSPLKREPHLRTGIICTLIFHIPDFSIMIFDPRYLFPMAFIGYIVEVIRYHTSLIQGYASTNERMQERLKDSLMSFAQVRLSKQILHDVKAIRRNLLFSLENQTEPSSLPEVLKREINRLQVYEQGSPKNPKELINLLEIVQTTSTLFEREFRSTGLNFTQEIPNNLNVKASRNDMLIVLINLIQNSLEAISSSENPWLHLHGFLTTDSVVLEVSDSGQIPIEQAAQIFKPGYSSKGGTRGLGLNIAQESLAANNALITLCENKENTTFQIIFPLPN